MTCLLFLANTYTCVRNWIFLLYFIEKQSFCMSKRLVFTWLKWTWTLCERPPPAGFILSGNTVSSCWHSLFRRVHREGSTVVFFNPAQSSYLITTMYPPSVAHPLSVIYVLIVFLVEFPRGVEACKSGSSCTEWCCLLFMRILLQSQSLFNSAYKAALHSV